MRVRLAAAGLAAILALGACATQAPAPQSLPPISFADQAPLRLAVGQVDVVNAYRSPLTDPYVEHLLPTSPAAAVSTWAQQRIAPVGGDGVLTVLVKDARVTEEKLPRTEGVRGVFTQDQAARYKARLEVELQANVPSRAAHGVTSAVVERSTTVPENVTLAERDRIWHELVAQLVRDLDRQLTTAIPNYMPTVLE